MSYVNTTSVMGVGIAFIITSLAAVATRFSLRLRKGGSLGADDWFSLAAMTLVIAACSVCIAGAATNAIGGHSPDIGPAIFTYEDARQTLNKKLEFAFYALLIPALTLLKLSVLFFYRRIFQIRQAFQVCFWFLTAASIAWGIAFFIAWTALCENHFDNRLISLMTLTTKCGDTFTLLVCQAVLDVVVDLGIIILPIPFVMKLKMSVKNKLAVLGVLLVGSLAIGCGIARAIIVGMILGTPVLSVPSIAGVATTDFIGIVSLMIFWGQLELGVAMVAVCLPVMRPMLKGESVISALKGLKTFISLSGGSSRSGSYSGGRSDRDVDGATLEEGDTIEKKMEYEVTSSVRADSEWEKEKERRESCMFEDMLDERATF